MIRMLIFILTFLLDSERLSFYGVYDGHAGDKASKYCAQILHKNLAEKFPKGVCMACGEIPHRVIYTYLYI